MPENAAAVQPCECGQIVPEGERHCWFHHVAEHPRRAYRGCFECGHVWTKRSLKRAYRRELLSVPTWEHRNILWSENDGFSGPSWVSVLWRVLTVRADNIYFCQLCIHDW